MSNPMGFERLFSKVQDRFDVRVVMYVRRQDDFLEAAWQQWEVKRGRSLLSWVIGSIGRRGDWDALLAPWAEALGDDRIVVRVYGRQRFVGGDVFGDFCSVLGVDALALERPDNRNVGMYPLVSHLVEGRSCLFDGPNDNQFYAMLREVAPELVAKGADSASLFSADEAERIMLRYEQSNERVRRRYLPQEKPPLFPYGRIPDGTSAESPQSADIAAFERELLQALNLYRKRRLKAPSPMVGGTATSGGSP